jgi:hypothetical protein
VTKCPWPQCGRVFGSVAELVDHELRARHWEDEDGPQLRQEGASGGKS